jgi:hypothetical protein
MRAGIYDYGIVQQAPSAVYYACVQPVKSSFSSPGPLKINQILTESFFRIN